ncbi:MAG: exopolysaccharide biosynthesis protein [Ruminococcaceae bacterium]|nr:exopolysaccharide biosynthesis protein [Oscillospiraceae bacterium]
MSDKYKRLAKDTGLFAISNFGSKILVFLLTPLYTAVLTTEEFGIADLINSTIQFIYPLLTLAISEATLRFALDNNEDKSQVFITSLLFVLIAVILLSIASPIFATRETSLKGYWGIFVVSFALFNIQVCFSNFIKGIGKTKLFAIQGILQTISVIGCNILLLIVFKLKLKGYLISVIVGYIVPIIFVFFAGKLYKYIKFSKPDVSLIKEMLRYSIPMIPTILAWAINTSIDKYMIIGMQGLAESGIYSVAHKIPTIITAIVSVFLQAWQLSAISNHGSEEEGDYYAIMFSGLNTLCLISGMVLILSSKFISGILFAESYFLAWKCVPMLMVASIFSNYAGFFAAAFRAVKKTKSLFTSVCIGALLNIVLNIVFIKIFGIIGASIATSISFSVVFFIRFIMVRKIIEVKINFSNFLIAHMILFLCALLMVLEFPLWYTGIGAIIVLLIKKNDILYFFQIIKQKIARKR